MTSRKPLILVSNDDGIQAPGLRVLLKFLRRLKNVEVVTVAPNRQQSASSHSLTLHRPLRVHKEAPGEYSVDGTPTDCIMLAVYEILKRKPDLVVSGINSGANLGDDVHYSGTVSAAIEGALMGIRAVAVSLVVWGEGGKNAPYFETAAAFAKKLCRNILSESPLPVGAVLNVNVPNLPAKQVKGYAFTKLGKRNYGGLIYEKTDPRKKKYYWIGGDDRTFVDIPGSDGNVIQEKKISVTPLQIDFTHYPLIDQFNRQLKSWKL